MTTTQPLAWLVTDAVAKRLGLMMDPDLRAQVLKKLPAVAGDPAQARERVLQAGTPFELAWLDRPAEREELEQLARQGAFPVLVLAAAAAGEPAIAYLAHGRHGGDVQVTVIAEGAVPREVPMPVDAFAALAASAGGALCLVPVNVTPSVSLDAGHGADHAHPTAFERLKLLMRQERREILLALFYAVVSALLSLALPLAVQAITSLAVTREIIQPAALLILFVVIATAIGGVLTIAEMHVLEVIQQRVFARIALEFATRVPRLQVEAVNAEDLPELMNRFFEVVTLQKSIPKLLMDGLAAGLQVVFGLVLLAFYHPYFLGFAAILVVSLGVLLRWTYQRGLDTALKESKYKYRVVHWLEEMARTIGTMKLAGRSNLPLDRMDRELSYYLKARRGHFGVLVTQGTGMVAFKVVITAALLVLGMVLVSDQQITLGQFVASEVIVVTILAGIEKLILTMPTVYDALVAVEKSGHVTDLPVEAAGGLLLPEHDKEPGVQVTTRSLSYRYPESDDWAIRDVSLSMDGGAVVAVTGLEGAGQSTLLKLLGGMLPGYHGAIVYNGVSLRDLDPLSFRQQVGGTLAAPELFEGTIEENISLGRTGIRTEDVLLAIERVGLAEQVQLLPEGIDTRITNGGRLLPMTMVRKIALARAIAGRPKLLIIDDLFEHLEPGYRREVIRLLSDRDCDWTVLAATHDPMYLSACDWIFWLEGGRVAREGTYAELMEDATFRALVSQTLELNRSGEAR
ncbi:MAG: ATP-binding cassette domain-containing protein [Gemmatimonadales bacterium]|nr:ATP-binding cassette domain-containing protein [Gemmatimonadales bacterium]